MLVARPAAAAVRLVECSDAVTAALGQVPTVVALSLLLVVCCKRLVVVAERLRSLARQRGLGRGL